MKRLLFILSLVSTFLCVGNTYAATTPIDTIDVVCHDLKLDDTFIGWFGMVYIFANNSEYELTGVIFTDSLTQGTFSGSDQCLVDLKHIATQTPIASVDATLTLSMDENRYCVIKGNMLGEDNIYYNLDLSWTVPAPTDTVAIAFDNSAWVAYYPDLGNDFMLSNENENYDIALDIVGVPMDSAFTEKNLNIPYCMIVNKATNDSIKVAAAQGRVWQSNDTTYMTAAVVGFDAVLYDIALWYAVPEVKETVTINIANATFYNELEKEGYYSLVGTTEDKSIEFAISLLGDTEEDIPGTYINDGVFGNFTGLNYDFINYIGGQYSTYIAKWNEESDEYEVVTVEKGEAKVTMDENKDVSLQGSFIGKDGVKYQITMTSKVDKPRFEDDAQSGAVERVLTGTKGLTIDVSQLEQNGIIRFELMTDSELLALWFLADRADADIVIPEGLYYINESDDYESVIAGDGSLGKSFYATHDGEYFTSLYFLLTGTVQVSKNEDNTLHMEINALNSYDVPVHIIYDALETGLEGVSDANTDDVRKQLINGRLHILRNGEMFNVMGSRINNTL